MSNLSPAALEFLETLKRSRLLSIAQLAEARARVVAGAPPREVAEAFATRGDLTTWQARQVLAGHHAFYMGKYKLLEKLGGGGMGVVFKAHHAMTGRTVALKVMSRGMLSHPTARARFQREVRVVAALNHPNVITAFDADCVGDTYFLVMEFGQGRDLKAWIKEFGRLPIAWSCECICQAALGLQHAHERGLVHRDIKPDNLLVDIDAKTGRPMLKILDMGLARLVDDAVELKRFATPSGHDNGDDDVTQAGQIMGTPDYIAPEQAEGSGRADIRSDIFSLGCTLFRLLTGESPFPGENATEKLLARVTLDAVRLRCLRSDLPAGLDETVARMLARDPNDRYQVPAEVVEALAPFAVGDEHSADGPSAIQVPPSPPAEVGLDRDWTPASFLSQLASKAEMIDTNASGFTLDARKDPRDPSQPPTRWPIVIAVGAMAAAFALVALFWLQSRPAVLEIAWPINERRGARLDIDDQRVRLPEQDPALIEVESGQRKVFVRRRGFEPIEWRIEIKPGQRVRRAVDWEGLELESLAPNR